MYRIVSIFVVGYFFGDLTYFTGGFRSLFAAETNKL